MVSFTSIFLNASSSGTGVASVVLTALFALGYLVLLYRESASFKAFIRLTSVRVIFVGTGMLCMSFWLVNVFFEVPNQPSKHYEKQQASPIDTQPKNTVFNYSDTLFYDPHTFLPYLDDLFAQTDSLHKGSVRRYIIENETKEIYDYWKGISQMRAGLTEPTDLNLGSLYLGYFLYHEQAYSKAIGVLQKTSDTLYYRNYLLGLSATKLQRYREAEQAFLAETRLPRSQFREKAFSQLADNYLLNNDHCAYLSLLKMYPEGVQKAPSWQKRLMVLECEGLTMYYAQAFTHYYSGTTWHFAISSLLISLVWMVYFYFLDLFNKEKRLLLATTFVLETFFMVLLLFPWLDYQNAVLGNESHDSFWLDFVIRIGLPEESIKIIPLSLVLWLFRKEFEEPYDIILFAVFSACGFAFMENMLYIERYDYDVMSDRAIISTLGHIVATSIVAYGLVLLKFRPKPWRRLKLVWYFALACLVHGLFDYLLVYNMFILSLVLFFVGLTFMGIIINNSINNSPRFTYFVPTQPAQLVQLLVAGFILIFTYEYVLANFTLGTEIANQDLLGGVFMNFCLLFFIVTKLSSFDLVKGFWKEIYLFKTPQEFKSRATFNPFVFIVQYFVSNSIYPQNFVGLKIWLKPHPSNHDLARMMQGTRAALFADRVIVKEYEKVGKEKYISFLSEKFFVVVLNYPIVYERFSSPVLLLRFRSNTVSLGGLPKQSVKLYFVDDLAKVKQKDIDLKDFPYLGMAIINLNEQIEF